MEGPKFGIVFDGYFLRSRRVRSREEAIADLMRIRGVGEKMAEKLYKKGFRSPLDVSKAAGGVPTGVRLCARYVDDLEKEISLDTARAFVAWLEVELLRASTKSPLLKTIRDVLIVGAHRRGSSSTHDIDILIVSGKPLPADEKAAPPADEKAAPPAEKTLADVKPSPFDSLIASPFDSLIASPPVEKSASLADVAASPFDTLVGGGRADTPSDAISAVLADNPSFRGEVSRGDWQYDLLWQIGKTVRMVEMYLAPINERGAALLHTTGPLELNILLRRRAAKMGLSLSQHGLFRVASDKKKGESPPVELIHAATERGIFEALGLKFIPADERDDEKALHDVVHTPLPVLD